MSTYAPARARRSVRRLLVVAAATALGLGVATQATAAPTAAHEQKVKAKIKRDTLEINGTFRSDTIALRLRAGDAGLLQVDLGDNGSAEFRFDRERFDHIVVDARGGGRRAPDRPGERRLHRHHPNHPRRGGRKRHPHRGLWRRDPARRLGNDSSTATRATTWRSWAPATTRSSGIRATATTPSRASRAPTRAVQRRQRRRAHRVSPVGGPHPVHPGHRQRHHGHRRRGAIVLQCLGGADTVTVHDLAGTDLDRVDADLAAALTGGAGDGQPDAVIGQGDGLRTTRSRSIRTAPRCACPAWPRRSRVTNGEPALDQVLVDPLDGADRAHGEWLGRGDETITIAPAAVAGHIRVASSTASTSIDLVSTEELLVQALGGDDTIAGSNGLAALTDLTVRRRGRGRHAARRNRQRPAVRRRRERQHRRKPGRRRGVHRCRRRQLHLGSRRRQRRGRGRGRVRHVGLQRRGGEVTSPSSANGRRLRFFRDVATS